MLVAFSAVTSADMSHDHEHFILVHRLQGKKEREMFKTLEHEATSVSWELPILFLMGRGATVQLPSGHDLTVSPLTCSRFRNCVYTYRILPDKENKLIVQVSHAMYLLVPLRCT